LDFVASLPLTGCWAGAKY